MRDLWIAHFSSDFALPMAPAERECVPPFARQLDLVEGCPSVSRSSLRLNINVAGYEAVSAECSAEQSALKSRTIQRYQQHCATLINRRLL